MNRWVDISFDCLPLRSVTRLDIPIDASPKFRARCEAIKRAIDLHGSHNTYYLYNARCVFHLTNSDQLGMIEYRLEGTLFTDEQDLRTVRTDLNLELVRETCDWLTEPVVKFLRETVAIAVQVEFDRYIAAGDLEQAKQRIERMQAATEKSGGYVGMYL